MEIQDSILAGEILSLLENVSGSIRIVDLESMVQPSKGDINVVTSKLLSEGLVKLIEEENRNAIVLAKDALDPRCNPCSFRRK